MVKPSSRCQLVLQHPSRYPSQMKSNLSCSRTCSFTSGKPASTLIQNIWRCCGAFGLVVVSIMVATFLVLKGWTPQGTCAPIGESAYSRCSTVDSCPGGVVLPHHHRTRSKVSPPHQFPIFGYAPIFQAPSPSQVTIHQTGLADTHFLLCCQFCLWFEAGRKFSCCFDFFDN